ncbi:MAG: asparagine synthase C-terminal domain-containing protein, partial [Myxococcota bacterium]
DRTVCPLGLSAYLTYEGLPETQTIYRQAHKLLPGCALRYGAEGGRALHWSFWQPMFGEASAAWPQVHGRNEDDLAEQLWGRIRAATEARLIADVPLGVLLSGGVDSSLIAAAMADVVPPSQIKTFSVTFADPSFDESSYARKVSAHLGTEHHEEQLSPTAMIDILPEVADFLCEPLGDGSLMPTYLLSRFARRSVTVALGGDGGDELFLGYPTFFADAVSRRLDAILSRAGSGRAGQTLGRWARWLPVSNRNFSFDFKVKRFAQGLGFREDFRHQAWMGSFMPHELFDVLNPQIRAEAMAVDPYDIVARFTRTGAARGVRDHLDAAVYQYIRLYLTANVLVKVDRASMARSLEVRAPLLDRTVVEFAAAIDGRLRLNGKTTKYLLKKAARGRLPDEIIDRPKKGFGMPIGQWLRGPLRSLGETLLAPDRLAQQPYFSPQVVQRLWSEHQRGRADHRKPLWTLLVFQLWLDRYGPDARVEAPSTTSMEPPMLLQPTRATA